MSKVYLEMGLLVFGVIFSENVEESMEIMNDTSMQKSESGISGTAIEFQACSVDLIDFNIFVEILYVNANGAVIIGDGCDMGISLGMDDSSGVDGRSIRNRLRLGLHDLQILFLLPCVLALIPALIFLGIILSFLDRLIHVLPFVDRVIHR